MNNPFCICRQLANAINYGGNCCSNCGQVHFGALPCPAQPSSCCPAKPCKLCNSYKNQNIWTMLDDVPTRDYNGNRNPKPVPTMLNGEGSIRSTGNYSNGPEPYTRSYSLASSPPSQDSRKTNFPAPPHHISGYDSPTKPASGPIPLDDQRSYMVSGGTRPNGPSSFFDNVTGTGGVHMDAASNRSTTSLDDESELNLCGCLRTAVQTCSTVSTLGGCPISRCSMPRVHLSLCSCTCSATAVPQQKLPTALNDGQGKDKADNIWTSRKSVGLMSQDGADYLLPQRTGELEGTHYLESSAPLPQEVHRQQRQPDDGGWARGNAPSVLDGPLQQDYGASRQMKLAAGGSVDSNIQVVSGGVDTNNVRNPRANEQMPATTDDLKTSDFDFDVPTPNDRIKIGNFGSSYSNKQTSCKCCCGETQVKQTTYKCCCAETQVPTPYDKETTDKCCCAETQVPTPIDKQMTYRCCCAEKQVAIPIDKEATYKCCCAETQVPTPNDKQTTYKCCCAETQVPTPIDKEATYKCCCAETQVPTPIDKEATYKCCCAETQVPTPIDKEATYKCCCAETQVPTPSDGINKNNSGSPNSNKQASCKYCCARTQVPTPNAGIKMSKCSSPNPNKEAGTKCCCAPRPVPPTSRINKTSICPGANTRTYSNCCCGQRQPLRTAANGSRRSCCSGAPDANKRLTIANGVMRTSFSGSPDPANNQARISNGLAPQPQKESSLVSKAPEIRAPTECFPCNSLATSSPTNLLDPKPNEAKCICSYCTIKPPGDSAIAKRSIGDPLDSSSIQLDSPSTEGIEAFRREIENAAKSRQWIAEAMIEMSLRHTKEITNRAREQMEESTKRAADQRRKDKQAAEYSTALQAEKNAIEAAKMRIETAKQAAEERKQLEALAMEDSKNDEEKLAALKQKEMDLTAAAIKRRAAEVDASAFLEQMKEDELERQRHVKEQAEFSQKLSEMQRAEMAQKRKAAEKAAADIVVKRQREECEARKRRMEKENESRQRQRDIEAELSAEARRRLDLEADAAAQRECEEKKARWARELEQIKMDILKKAAEEEDAAAYKRRREEETEKEKEHAISMKTVVDRCKEEEKAFQEQKMKLIQEAAEERRKKREQEQEQQKQRKRSAATIPSIAGTSIKSTSPPVAAPSDSVSQKTSGSLAITKLPSVVSIAPSPATPELSLEKKPSTPAVEKKPSTPDKKPSSPRSTSPKARIEGKPRRPPNARGMSPERKAAIKAKKAGH